MAKLITAKTIAVTLEKDSTSAACAAVILVVVVVVVYTPVVERKSKGTEDPSQQGRK
jgi:hypothetical protein